MGFSITMQEDSILTISDVEEFCSIKNLFNIMNLESF